MSITSGSRWVGETGPEIRHLTGGERIYPAGVITIDLLKLADEHAAERHRDKDEDES
jgi:hypothetical protein